MTVGSAGACNVILKSILDAGDEVIVLTPCFSEYPFYITSHADRQVPVETGPNFLPDIERIAAAITPRTRAILLNTPNNPTGRIYPERVLSKFDAMLVRQDHEILVAALIANTVICNSWSKSQGLPGERIGYLALSPRLRGRTQLRAAWAFTNRILGFINAPAFWQLVELEALDATVDVSGYQRKRDLLCDQLALIGYDVRKPEGIFYVFLRTPLADDVTYVRLLDEEGVLGVPGPGFGRSGYMRPSLTVPEEMIRKSFPGFAAAFAKTQPAR